MIYKTANKHLATYLHKLGYRCVFDHQDGLRIYVFEYSENEQYEFKRVVDEYRKRN